MGNKVSGASSLKKREIKEYMQRTHFDYNEIDALYNHFKSIASSKNDDGVIDRKEFQSALGLSESLFLDRMFQLFDDKNIGQINFTEFLSGLSILCTRGTLEEKIQFSFRIFDFDNDGKISKQELGSMLHTSLKENKVYMTTEQIGHVVDSTFKEADTNGDGFIDFDEYKALVDNHPSILSNMTIDFKRVIDTRSEATEKPSN
mmetsp:Transcript_14907/g.16860  ORF Transcript_14907/g.16860 Transcript_14907/m.16860 type:complete len:203 (-) Transcript_14907:2225-2833(-)